MTTPHFHVMNMGGETVSIPLQQCSTVTDLKEYLCSLSHPFPIRHPWEINFIVEATDGTYVKMAEEALLSTYGIAEHTTVHLIINSISTGQFVRTYYRTAHSIRTPSRLCIHHHTLYVTLSHGHQVQAMNVKNGNLIHTYGSGRGTRYDTDITFPTGLAVSGQELFVADSENNRIQVFHAATGAHLRTYGKKGIQKGEFENISDLCLSPTNDELFVADYYNHRIQVLVASTGAYLRSYGAPIGWQSLLQQGYAILYNYPHSLYVVEDKLYIVADNMIYTLSASDGTPLSYYSHPMIRPSCICVSQGILFISDTTHHCIVMVRESDGIILRILGKASLLTATYPERHLRADFDYPNGMVFYGTNELFVADTYNNRIQVFYISPEEGAFFESMEVQ